MSQRSHREPSRKNDHLIIETQLQGAYPPSPACDCAQCRRCCDRPGWMTVEDAQAAIRAGYANRLMLDHCFDIDACESVFILCPALKGYEKRLAPFVPSSEAGCTFRTAAGACEIHGQPSMPLECAFTHHGENSGKGGQCHRDIVAQWKTDEAETLIRNWQRYYRIARRPEAVSAPKPRRNHGKRR